MATNCATYINTTNKNKNIFIDTNLDEVIDSTNFNNTSEQNEKENGLILQPNKSNFDMIIEGIVNYQKNRDLIIKLKIIGILFVINLFHICIDSYFSFNDNISSRIYLTISIYERIITSTLLNCIIVNEKLDNINFNLVTKNKLLYKICVIDNLRLCYYPIIGIAVSTNYYFMYSYIDATNIYIIISSIIKLCAFSVLSEKIKFKM
jgi:hypothetical protein